MPQFTLPNTAAGGSVTVNAGDLASAQQAAANQTGVSLSQQQGGGTFGGSSFGGGDVAANPGPATNNPYLTNTGDLAKFAAQTSGVTQAQLAQQKAEFDAQLAFSRDQMEKLGIPQLQINQQLAQLQQQQFQAQLSLAQQAQQYNQAATTAGLTGWFNAPPNVPNIAPQYGGMGQGQGGTAGGGAAGGGAPTQDQYVQARAAQLQSVAGMGATQASQTAQSEWTQGLAQAGNVAYGMPAGIGFGGAPGAAGGGWQAPSQTQYVQARTQQLMSAANMPQTQAQQTAAAEWTQGLAQQGNVAYGLPSGISFTAPAGTPSAGAATGGAVGGPGGGAQQTLQGQLQQAQLTGQYQGAPTEAASEFTRQLGLQQGQLGQQYLATAAQLQGPQNTFQLSNYLRGAQGNQAVPTYLQNLASNIGNPMFQGAGTTAPTTQTAAGLAGQLGGTQSATPGWDYNQTLGAIQGIMGRGAQSLRPGALEGLTPEELSALGSGIGAAGGSLPSFLQQYQQSRIGQGAATGTPTLA